MARSKPRLGGPRAIWRPSGGTRSARSHVETLMLSTLGFNQNDYTLASILLLKIVLCGQFHCTKFMNYKCFDMRSPIPNALHPTPYTLKPKALCPTPCTPHPAPHTLQPKLTPETLHLKPYALHPSPYTLNRKAYTLNSKPLILKPKASSRSKGFQAFLSPPPPSLSLSLSHTHTLSPSLSHTLSHTLSP